MGLGARCCARLLAAVSAPARWLACRPRRPERRLRP